MKTPKVVLMTVLPVMFFFNSSANAQKNNVYLTPDVQLDSLIQRYKDINQQVSIYDGFRIQIFSGNNRTNAEELKADFFKRFPNIGSYLIYQQPYFKLRVGDFRNRFEAQELYYQLLDAYGQAIIVPDKINKPSIK
jgi:hypothetical protein